MNKPQGACIACGSTSLYHYDGMLGYESVKCRACGHDQNDEIFHAQEVREMYDALQGMVLLMQMLERERHLDARHVLGITPEGKRHPVLDKVHDVAARMTAKLDQRQAAGK